MSPVSELEMEDADIGGDVLETGRNFLSPELNSDISDFDIGNNGDHCVRVEMKWNGMTKITIWWTIFEMSERDFRFLLTEGS